MRVVIFEDDGIEGFGPLTLLRHVGLLRRGTKSLLDAIVEKIPDARDVVLWGWPELSAVTKEGTGKAYNEKVYGPALLVNARARPTEGLLLQASLADPFVAVSGGELVAARLDTVPLKPGPIGRSVVRTLARRTKKLAAEPDPLFRGYWDLLEGNGLAIASQATRNEESLDLPRSVEVRGPSGNIMVDAGAEIEGQVTLDARLGPIVIKKGASVECFSRIMGPCYIGARTMVFSALIGGGTSIFETCKVGGQIENSVILPYTNKAHHGYVGDSY
ncbi:MAG TPA: putative sugar nucleotidyl transferase, partial [Nitrososphaerales archaeon]|nr:putative sugar nucleotidyl transferase [Nitrososphaerales archaeon]